MTRAQAIQWRNEVYGAIRTFFAERHYLEAQTPLLVASPDSEPTLTPMEVSVLELDGTPHQGALITSPEYALKKLLDPQELPRLFELARVFRNAEPWDALHQPAFTMLEWYHLGQSYEAGMEETIELIDTLAQALRGSQTLAYGERVISTRREDWWIVEVEELFARHAGLQDVHRATCASYQQALDRLNLDWRADDTIGDLFHRLLLNKIQPIIDAAPGPVMVTGYPPHAASLARLDERGAAQRFEVFVAGVELCNAYGELADAQEQRHRFERERAERLEQSKTVFPLDEDLLAAIATWDRPCFGNALGVERLMMLLKGGTSLQDMLTFPARQIFHADQSS